MKGLRTFPIARQGGVSLLEVLIAVVVLSIGLLGVAAMQNIAIINSQAANHHTLATTLAYDALDRARSQIGVRVVDGGTIPAAIVSAVEAEYNAPRYAERFPAGFQVSLQAEGPDLVVTVSWQDDRVADEAVAADGVTEIVTRGRLL